MAVKQDFEMHRGQDFSLRVVMSPATDITGWTLQFTLKNTATDASALFTKTTTAGTITISDATNGIFAVTILSANTSGLTSGPYVYDVQRTDSGSRTPIVYGMLNLLPSVGI